MTSPCQHPTEVVGPFPQTLFMGCSIQKFNLNLGWGREASTCTINMVVDPVPHPQDAYHNNKKSLIASNLAQGTNNTASNALTPQSNSQADQIDQNKSLHKNILKKEQDKEKARVANDINGIQDTNRQDTGKKIWIFGNNTAYNHTLKDPGFLADDFGILGNYKSGPVSTSPIIRRNDILGTLSHFRFDNTIFNGVVKTWNYSNGFIEVQLQSPTNLVKNTKLIINDYNGTISSVMPNTPMQAGSNISVPFDDPTLGLAFNASIYQGNIPNLINVLGFAGFQNLGYAEDRGVSLGAVYDYVRIMLAADSVSNQWNPYQGIVAKAIRNRENGTFLGYGHTLPGSNLTLDKYNAMDNISAVDGSMRPILDFDISEVPRPPNGVYVSDTTLSLLDFVDKCCEPVGLDYYFELIPSSGSRTACVKVRTISRRFQPSLDAIRGMVTSFTNNDYVTDFKFGQEFQDTKTRTVIMGGKQQRLFQANTETLGHYRHRRVFEPGINSFVDFSELRRSKNYYREPNTATYRNLIGPQFYTGPAGTSGAAVAQMAGASGGSDFNFVEASPFSEQQFLRGSYHPLTQLTDTNTIGSNVYFIGANDLVKPYFGKDINGNHRNVSFRKDIGETFLNVNMADLAALFPANDAPNLVGSVDVSETEIRCAMAGIDSWLNYIFEMPVLGKPIGMSTYIYNYMSQKFGGNFATSFFLNALNIFSADKGKLSALPAVSTSSPINIEGYLPYSESLWPALSNMHNFFQTIGNECYGRKFLVRLPNITSYIDGNGVRRYAYEVTDKAWEEPGNFIDDTIQIGSSVANSLANEDGTFGAIVGFDATAEFDSFFQDNATDSFINPFARANNLIVNTAKKSPLKWYWPLTHNIPRNEVYYMPFKQQITPEADLPEGAKTINPAYPNADSAHGEQPPNNNYRWKMYTRASVEDVYPQAAYNPKLTSYFGAPHCIISMSSPVFLDSPTQLIKTMMEEMLINDGTFLNGSMTGGSKSSFAYLLAWTIAEKGLRQGGTLLAPPMGNQQNLPIAPRAAVPIFAAIPLKSNFSCYGPWVSHPGLGYEGDNNLFNDKYPVSQINNLVGEVNVEHDDSAVPWNYGGIHAMDDSILVKIKDSNQYQQVLEDGTITTAGIMFLGSNLGGTLVANGPLINSVNVTIGAQGMSTTYTMRTYNRKVGFFNKDSSANIQRVNRQAIETRQQISQAIKELIGTASNQTNMFSQSLPKGMSYSPVAVLAGNAKPYLNGRSTLTNVYNDLGYDPSWAIRPNVGDQTITPKQYPMQKSITMLYDEQEMSDLLTSEFNRRSFMSLDGILSPISFYPTKYISTYHMTLYDRDVCPYCNGEGTYTYQQFSPPQGGEDATTGGTSDEMSDQRESKSKVCPFCTTSPDKGQNRKAIPAYQTPPYIITTTDDDSSYDIDPNTIGQKINKFTLNPIVMSKGEFGIEAAKQNGDECGHSIDVVGFGEDAPSAGDSLRPSTADDIDVNFQGNVNQRFFGLRGPVMVHGWGYDLDGYPVPNSSGQLKQLANGDFVSITQFVKDDGTISEPYRTNDFYKGWAQQPGTWPVGPIDLRWDGNAGVWTVGSQYKDVWVTIEVDLKGTQPSRGTIFGLNETDEALADGERRLVFVKDPIGTFAAPRGASIYCKYDPTNGFYQPLYNNSVVTSGKFEGSNTATIYQSYKRNYDEENPTNYTANFRNPLGLTVTVGSVGLFGYVNGYWVLQNVK